MATATILLREGPTYRIDAFITGLRALKFSLTRAEQRFVRPGDLLIIWNRNGQFDQIATRYEKDGATVLVVENGWIGRDGHGRQFLAMCKSHHNGAGKWNVRDPSRWEGFKIQVQPWREKGKHVLIVPQRGIGPKGVAMPVEWPRQIVNRLRLRTKRTLRYREHPGVRRHDVPIEPDFVNAHAVVTWGSGGAIKAISQGIPVFYEMPDWIGAPAATRGIDDIENVFLGDRLPMFRRLAWAMWRVDEIASGEAFKCLLT